MPSTCTARACGELHNASLDVSIDTGYPPVINSRREAELAFRAARDVVGDAGLMQLDHPSMGAEDFSYYLERIPGCVLLMQVASSDLGKDLGQSVARPAESCRTLGMRLVGAGTHPFSTRLAAITPGPRYESMERTSGLLGHRQITFSTHVHLSVIDGDEALWLARQLAPYLPLMLALSASSPFWQGHDTRFAAFRPRILASRFGLDARVAVNENGDVMTLREVARQTLDLVADTAARFGDTDHLSRLARAISAGLPSERQRRRFAATGSLRAVVDAVIDELLRDPVVG